jgi:hypothetical protein
MPFVPSTTAQQIAALAGTNQAGLATPLTGLQASIAAGNLAPAALIDAIVSCFGPQYHGRWASLGVATTTGGSMGPVGNGTSTGFPSAVFTPKVTRNYSMLITAMSKNNTVGGITWWDFQKDGAGLALTPPWMGHHALANGHVSIATQTKADLVAGISYTFRLLWGSGGADICTVDGNDGWSLIIL